jgi:hypothetical protein
MIAALSSSTGLLGLFRAELGEATRPSSACFCARPGCVCGDAFGSRSRACRSLAYFRGLSVCPGRHYATGHERPYASAIPLSGAMGHGPFYGFSSDCCRRRILVCHSMPAVVVCGLRGAFVCSLSRCNHCIWHRGYTIFVRA